MKIDIIGEYHPSGLNLLGEAGKKAQKEKENLLRKIVDRYDIIFYEKDGDWPTQFLIAANYHGSMVNIDEGYSLYERLKSINEDFLRTRYIEKLKKIQEENKKIIADFKARKDEREQYWVNKILNSKADSVLVIVGSSHAFGLYDKLSSLDLESEIIFNQV